MFSNKRKRDILLSRKRGAIILATIGERIRNFRNLQGFTQVEAAKRAGINVSLYSQYELGIRNPKQSQIEKIARALKIHPFFLNEEYPDDSMFFLSTLYRFAEIFGDIGFLEQNDKITITLPTDEITYRMQLIFQIVAGIRKASPTKEAFMNGLLGCQGVIEGMTKLQKAHGRVEPDESSSSHDEN